MPDFEEILNQWENSSSRRRHPMEDALDRYPPSGRSKREKRPGDGSNHRTAGRRLPVVEEVDLHGMKVEEALRFCDDAVRRNVRPGERRRIIVVHGKGIHSPRGSRLSETIREFLRQHPLVGETGVPPAKEGGDGATWAVCRQRSR